MTPDTRAIDVLLIEDDPGDILITREAFEHHKIHNTLRVAHDGQEGLDYLYRRGPHHSAPQPDLILLDLNLPKYDGHQLLEQIKSDPDLCHIPSLCSPPRPPRKTFCAATDYTRMPTSPNPLVSNNS